mmetsp:Transcript_16611/g.45638  ORF Transcript_16611/g.45638 Transcript_16611/m.45638 type:complete len:215 (-) Transcript_16611:112-756(-)
MCPWGMPVQNHHGFNRHAVKQTLQFPGATSHMHHTARHPHCGHLLFLIFACILQLRFWFSFPSLILLHSRKASLLALLTLAVLFTPSIQQFLQGWPWLERVQHSTILHAQSFVLLLPQYLCLCLCAQAGLQCGRQREAVHIDAYEDQLLAAITDVRPAGQEVSLNLCYFARLIGPRLPGELAKPRAPSAKAQQTSCRAPLHTVPISPGQPCKAF